MTKGKPWPLVDEAKLKELLKSGKVDLDLLRTKFEGKYSKQGIRQKMISLGLIEQQHGARGIRCCSFKRLRDLDVPEELPTIEEALKKLAAVLTQLETPGLDNYEIMRLGTAIKGFKIYKEIFADYADYRGLEDRLIEMEARYRELIAKGKTSSPS